MFSSQGTLLVKAYSLTNLTVKARDIKSIATLKSELVRFSMHNSEIWVMHFLNGKKMIAWQKNIFINL